MASAALFDLVLRPLLFTALAGLALLPLERLVRARPPRRTGFATDLAFATCGQVLTRVLLVFGVGWALSALDAIAVDRPLFQHVVDPRLRSLLDVASGLLLFELGGYGYHRLAHRVPWLWRLHAVHHSSETMDWLAAFRQHPLEIVLMTLVQNAPLVLLGVPLGAHASVLLLLRLHTVFVHSNLRVPAGPWSLVVAMPCFHHRHHQRDGAPRNFAALFPFIDRCFGTASAQPSTEFGSSEPLPQGFVGLLLHPFGISRRRRSVSPAA